MKLSILGCRVTKAGTEIAKQKEMWGLFYKNELKFVKSTRAEARVFQKIWNGSKVQRVTVTWWKEFKC